MASSRLDLIVFGATGYTGKYVVKHAARFCKDWQLNFAIAGRRKKALEAVLKEFAPDAENIPIILADINDEESLRKMTESTKVLATCCGPYRLCGEAVVKACIATRTHYVDVSGEPQFIENVRLSYNKAAREAGVYIVSACGLDSIPADLGVIFAQSKFGGEVNSIETYLTMNSETTESGPVINYTTWESAVHSLAHWNELKTLRAKLYSNKLPKLMPKLRRRIIHKNDIDGKWSTIFIGSDRSVALSTQQFLYEKYKKRPAQVYTYITLKSLFHFMLLLISAIIFRLMTLTEFTCKLLLKYPTLFSGGWVGRKNIETSHETLKLFYFSTTFKALGWSEKLTEPTDKHTDPPNKELITKVSSCESIYDVTAIAVILSAIMILKEVDKMPDNGGALSPGAAFYKTSLIEELNKNNIKFEVINTIEK